MRLASVPLPDAAGPSIAMISMFLSTRLNPPENRSENPPESPPDSQPPSPYAATPASSDTPAPRTDIDSIHDVCCAGVVVMLPIESGSK